MFIVIAVAAVHRTVAHGDYPRLLRAVLWPVGFLQYTQVNHHHHRHRHHHHRRHHHHHR